MRTRTELGANKCINTMKKKSAWLLGVTKDPRAVQRD